MTHTRWFISLACFKDSWAFFSKKLWLRASSLAFSKVQGKEDQGAVVDDGGVIFDGNSVLSTDLAQL